MTSSLNIGVLGYYGFGNAGDEFILDNIRRLLEPHHVIPIPLGLAGGSDTVRRLNALDFILLGGGGLYREAPPAPFKDFDRWGELIQTPIGVIGLGVTQLQDQHTPATQALIRQSLFFIVRDEESRRLLSHPKVQVAPDLTFYSPLMPPRRDRGEGDRIVCGVNLRPVHPAVDEWMQTLRQMPYAIRALPFATNPTLGDLQALRAIDPRCPPQFTPDIYSEIDFLIGTAFHSIVFAIQTATPVLAINYDPKVERLMNEVGLGRYLLAWEDWGLAIERIETLLADQEIIRTRMIEYTRRAKHQLDRTLTDARELIETAGRSRRLTRRDTAPKARVSVLVDARSARRDEVRRTLISCFEQTHEDIEVLLLTGPRPESGRRWNDRWPALRLVPITDDRSDWVVAGLQAMSGDYVTWLRAGSWLAPDAITLLMGALEADRAAEFTHACYFLTRDGVIERKIRLHRAHSPAKPQSIGPCLLARRSAAQRIRELTRAGPDTAVPRQVRSVYLREAIFYRRSTESERLLYLSVLAFRQDDLVRAKRLFHQALQAGKSLQDCGRSHDLVDLISNRAQSATAGPSEFVDHVIGSVPGGAQYVADLKKRVSAHLLMKQFFQTPWSNKWRRMLHLAWLAVKNDPSWIGNRGVWVTLLRALGASFWPGAARPRESAHSA